MSIKCFPLNLALKQRLRETSELTSEWPIDATLAAWPLSSAVLQKMAEDHVMWGQKRTAKIQSNTPRE